MKKSKRILTGVVLFTAGLLAACNKGKEDLSSLALMGLIGNSSATTNDGTTQNVPFGTAGYTTYAKGNNVVGVDTAIQSDGKILVAGTIYGTNTDIAVWRYNSDSSIDTSFGNQGIVIIDGADSGNDYGNAVAVQSDGKILITGSIYSNTYNDDLVLIRLKGDGTFDTTFGNQGKAFYSDYYPEIGIDIAIRSDGKILVAGNAQDNINTSDEAALWIFNADGTNPIFKPVWIDEFTYGQSVGVLSDDSIVLSGTAIGLDSMPHMFVAKLTSVGNLDTSFGSSGYVKYLTGNSNGYSLAIQDDGKILISGDINTGSDMALWRYNANGTADTTFDTDGLVIRANDAGGSGNDFGNSVTLQSDGRILVTGSSVNSYGGTEMALWRFNANGSLDTSFDTDGIVTFVRIQNSNNGSDRGNALAIQSDGKILVAGESKNPDTAYAEMTLWRYKTDGTLDK